MFLEQAIVIYVVSILLTKNTMCSACVYSAQPQIAPFKVSTSFISQQLHLDFLLRKFTL